MMDGVQTTLIEKVPGVVKVRDITDHTTGANPYYS
jgi:Fe/S biogenesis protein NfuA